MDLGHRWQTHSNRAVRLDSDTRNSRTEVWGGNPVTNRAKSSQITLFTNIMVMTHCSVTK